MEGGHENGVGSFESNEANIRAFYRAWFVGHPEPGMIQRRDCEVLLSIIMMRFSNNFSYCYSLCIHLLLINLFIRLFII